MNKIYIITLLCLCSIGTMYSQQIVRANLLNENTSKEICLTNITIVDDGEVDHENLILNKLNSNQVGSAELEINYLSNSKITFSLEEAGGQSYAMILDNGTFSIPNSPPPVPNEPYSTGDIFKIERCNDGVTLYKNGLSYYTFSSANIAQSLVSKIYVESASLEGANQPHIKLSFPILVGCGGGSPQSEQGTFTALKKKLDGSYTVPQSEGVVFQPVLYFTYPEDYAITYGKNHELSYVVLNWKREIKASGELSNVYGANWQSLELPVLNSNSTDPVQYYILEVSGINKEETYYLRFAANFLEAPTN